MHVTVKIFMMAFPFMFFTSLGTRSGHGSVSGLKRNSVLQPHLATAMETAMGTAMETAQTEQRSRCSLRG
jgi:hypothetical protein